MKQYRAVVVGCGKIGALFEAERRRPKPASHAGAIVANRKTQLVALVDTDARALAKAGKLFKGAARYTSFVRCLKKERPDIVVIATPPSARASLIRMCVRAGIRMIICEKPLAESVRDTWTIRKLLARSPTTFVLNYQRRFSPLFDSVRRALQKGTIGAVQQITCYYSNGIRNNGGHIIDALLYLTNDRITSVQAMEHTRNTVHPRGDSNLDALLHTARGATITLQSFDQHKYALHDIHILGTTGAVVITDFGQRALWSRRGPSAFAGINELRSKPMREQRAPLSATSGALKEALDCVGKKRLPRSGVKNGADVLRIIGAMKKSARRDGMRVVV